jgi:WD40 repeat protein
MDEVFLICNLNKEADEPYKISSFSIRNNDDPNQFHGKNSTLNILRPLRVWVENRCIALSQSGFTVSIWKWNDDGTTELTLINELKGHKSIVTDCQQLANGNYITISHDKTVRVWQKNGNKNRSLLDSIIFMGDFPFTALYLSTKTNHVIIGDEMGNIHWLEFNIHKEYK